MAKERLSHARVRGSDGRPLKGVPREEHVPDQGLNGSLANQADKEQLFDHGGRNSAE